MTVMPDMTDSADGFLFTRNLSFYFILINQTLALDISSAKLWHVSCLIHSYQNMSNIMLSVKFEYLSLSRKQDKYVNEAIFCKMRAEKDY